MEMRFWLNSPVLLWQYGVVVFLVVEKLNLDDSRITQVPSAHSQQTDSLSTWPDMFCWQRAQPVWAFSSCCKNMAMHMVFFFFMEGNSHPACNPEPCTNYRADFKGMLGLSAGAWNIQYVAELALKVYSSFMMTAGTWAGLGLILK